MPEDVEMDAPQISTLREEESPEPPAAPKPAPSSSPLSKKRPPPAESEEEDDDEEDEEDQLIDDDEEEEVKSVPPPAPPPVPAASARSTPAKRSAARGRGGGRKRVGRGGADTPSSRPTPIIESWNSNEPSGATVSATTSNVLKKRAPAKSTAAPKATKKRATKTAKAIPANLRDEAGSVREAYPPTAASSPMPHDEHSPEPEIPHILIPPVSHPPGPDDISLEGVPLPVYPLPSKPFPVQPPPKIGTGFAPVIPLDKGGKPVRRWRQANKEVRGIAGGRWFARSWIGDKESEFAAAHATISAQVASHLSVEHAFSSVPPLGSVIIPKLPTLSISAAGSGRATPRVKAIKADAGIATGASSRAGSAGPESTSAQAPSRKRSNLQAVSEAATPVSVSTPIP
ncbi:hypothetical protein ABKN59_002724 [Abortiporus biennis]